MIAHNFKPIGAVGLMVVSALSLSGCGAPDFSVLHPNAPKRSVQIFVVGPSSSATVSALTQQLDQAQFVSSMTQVSAGAAMDSVTKAVYAHPTALCIVVDPAPRLEGFSQFVASMSKTPFAWVGTAVQLGLPSDRTTQMVTSQTASAYTLGWLAAQTAVVPVTGTVPTIGLLTDDLSGITRAQLQSALGGVYSGNPQAVVQTVTLTMAQPWPSTWLVARPLTPTEQSMLATNHVHVISLVDQSGSSVFAEPALPDVSTVVGIATNYVSGSRNYGVHSWSSSPLIQVDSSQLAPTVTAGLPVIEDTASTNTNITATAWANVPSSVKATWSTWVNAVH